jgi:hypothetical protein
LREFDDNRRISVTEDTLHCEEPAVNGLTNEFWDVEPFSGGGVRHAVVRGISRTPPPPPYSGRLAKCQMWVGLDYYETTLSRLLTTARMQVSQFQIM